MTRIPARLTRRQLISAAAASTAGAAIGMPAWAQQPDEILIGQSAHLSGPLAPSFTAVVKGQSLAIADINARGGIGGRPVRLITLDDAYNPKRTVENVNRLIDQDKVTALYGLASTASVGAVMPILAAKKVPLVGVYTGSPSLRMKHHPYFFTTMASYYDEVVQMLRNLETLQRTRIGVVYQTGPLGQLMLPVLDAAMKQVKATIVVKAPLDPSGKDAVQAVEALAKARPQAVIVINFGPSMIPLVKGSRKLLGVPLYCISIANSKALLTAMGDDARGLAFTQLIPYPWRPTTNLVRDFSASMKAANLPIDYDHYFGYLNLRVLLEGMRRAGRNVTSDTLVASLEGMRKTDLGGYTVDFSPTNHHGSKFVEITMYGPGGRYVR